MKRIVLVFFLILPILAAANIFTSQNIKVNDRGYLFEIHGSNTIGAELAPALVEKWLHSYNFQAIQIQATNVENEKIVQAISSNGIPVKIFIAAHGSGTGFKSISIGLADIAAASRPIKDSENELFSTINATDFESETVLAIDGLAVIVNPTIKIETLTIEQVGQLFSGQIKNWSELGGPRLKVSVYARDNKSGTFDTFNTLVLKRGFNLVDSALRYESNDILSEKVANTPGAIGFTSLASIGHSKAVKIQDGTGAAMAPQHEVIATEDYPLARRLYLYQIKSKNEYAIDFLAFAKSKEGQNIVNEVGFVSQNLDEISLPIHGTLPIGYTLIAENSMRITTNFRFKSDNKTLDNKAQDDVQRLAEYMERPENQGRKLILIGFSNQQRNEFKARLLSETRVITVKNALKNVGVVASALTGYGQINPVASNADLKYALRNQRVEVWIR